MYRALLAGWILLGTTALAWASPEPLTISVTHQTPTFEGEKRPGARKAAIAKAQSQALDQFASAGVAGPGELKIVPRQESWAKTDEGQGRFRLKAEARFTATDPDTATPPSPVDVPDAARVTVRVPVQGVAIPEARANALRKLPEAAQAKLAGQTLEASQVDQGQDTAKVVGRVSPDAIEAAPLKEKLVMVDGQPTYRVVARGWVNPSQLAKASGRWADQGEASASDNEGGVSLAEGPNKVVAQSKAQQKGARGQSNQAQSATTANPGQGGQGSEQKEWWAKSGGAKRGSQVHRASQEKRSEGKSHKLAPGVGLAIAAIMGFVLFVGIKKALMAKYKRKNFVVNIKMAIFLVFYSFVALATWSFNSIDIFLAMTFTFSF